MGILILEGLHRYILSDTKLLQSSGGKHSQSYKDNGEGRWHEQHQQNQQVDRCVGYRKARPMGQEEVAWKSARRPRIRDRPKIINTPGAGTYDEGMA